ncbi:hypothetical protein MmTuc01_1721 [Methanosarcina mazei Tuc01]|uniref:Uncharacterized protein n=1 Tax=Methanosarcina mazei Tuc01 TaxID=1236903 RepID=M1QA44_METMZ|nr:hypothetical protein MmTuc01_1721 [Methanosarcina mazei Tuc01]
MIPALSGIGDSPLYSSLYSLLAWFSLWVVVIAITITDS